MKKQLFYSTIIVAVIFTSLIFSCKKDDNNNNNNNNTNSLCAHTTCVNGGTATATTTSCYCKCANGFVGDSCQTNVFGTYSGVLINTSTSATSTATMILTGASGATTFIINYGGNLTATWGAAGGVDYFTLNSQTVNNTTFSGSGSFQLGYLEFQFSQAQGTLSNNFSFQGTKQ